MYIKNLKQDEKFLNKTIKAPWFLIEVMNPFNLGKNIKHEIKDLNIIYSDLLINKLERTQLNGIIVINYRSDNNDIYMLRNEKNCLDLAKENSYSLCDYEYETKDIKFVAYTYSSEEELTLKKSKRFK